MKTESKINLDQKGLCIIRNEEFSVILQTMVGLQKYVDLFNPGQNARLLMKTWIFWSWFQFVDY